ncbi:hypothetical protein [Leptolyngbya sp. PCC 6406]|uniref:hypothetical protein n=1 Tax=Leptolyngbya sp. PCC 6406 TaxID=1173264 RepID=UPI0002AD003D|nr:hypothetical protein [Leptolyngbya sp. PCC 6406]
MPHLTWIQGPTRSGKTARLLSHLRTLAADQKHPTEAVFLVMAANGDNRLALVERIAAELPPSLPLTTATPAGFVQNEVILFWPLLVESLGLSPQFPMKLRPEKEQELATALWQPWFQVGAMVKDQPTGGIAVPGWTTAQIVRRSLDFLQLAAAAGIPAEDIGSMVMAGMPPGTAPPEVWQTIGTALVTWRDWCLQGGLLTYAIAMELYWRHLLPLSAYRDRWQQRFLGVVADDLDEYPAMVGRVIATALDLDCPVAVSWNPQGQVRLGVGADPQALEIWRHQSSEVITLPEEPETPAHSLAATWAEPIVQGVLDPIAILEPVEPMAVVQATSRGELLRRTAEAIGAAVQAQQVAPRDIAVIGPGFDAIARYSLAEILAHQGISVASLNDQRPLVSSPLVRAVLTLLPLVYPGLGRLLDRDAIAEMLVVLSQSPQGDPQETWMDRVQIDPVRAELIADHCFRPDPDQPDLLAVTEFPRWDRLGYQATEAYEQLRQWIAAQRQARQQRLLTSPVNLIDRAIQTFLWRGSILPYDQLAALRELLETAQHFWEVESRLRQQRRSPSPFQPPDNAASASGETSPEGRFLSLLHQGIVTANPYPVKATDPQQGVTLSTVFQYRSQRLVHPWQFWLDAGSPRWLTGSDELFGYQLFQQNWTGRPWTLESVEQAHEARLERILRDLLGRTTERVVLCHSDLAVNGQEQAGPLLGLVLAQGDFFP